MPPEQAQQQPQQPMPEEGGGDGFTGLLEQTFKGLLDINSIMEQQGAPPEAMQAVQASLQALQGAVKALQGGGQPGQQQAAPQMQDAMQGKGQPVAG